jgi:hypothetical protein
METIPELNIAMMPFFPDQQQALTFAKERIQKDRKFEGYLPFGEYTIAGSTFTVAQGTSAVVNVKPVGSASDAVAQADNPKKPKKDASDSANASTGLRLDLGFAAANAGNSTEVGQAIGFGGVGTRVGVGMGYGLSDTLSLVAEVGYHGSFGAGEASPLNAAIGMYDATPTIYNGAFGWLAASMSFNDLEVLVGPVAEFASVQTQGLNISADQVEYTGGQGTYVPVQGSLLASGLSGGVTYAAMDVGDGLRGGISTYVGAQSDGSRLYTWGQVSVTIKGQ